MGFGLRDSGEAQLLVTGDEDLLTVAPDSPIRIVAPREAWAHLRGYRGAPSGHYRAVSSWDWERRAWWCSSRWQRPVVHHWRTTAQRDVDFVVEQPNGTVLPVEVKATATPGAGDTPRLRAFLDGYPDLAVGGLLIHGGDESLTRGCGIVGPWWRVM